MAATDRHDSDYSGNETRNDFEELRERAIRDANLCDETIRLLPLDREIGF
jgi:hypothetical protein